MKGMARSPTWHGLARPHLLLLRLRSPALAPLPDPAFTWRVFPQCGLCPFPKTSSTTHPPRVTHKQLRSSSFHSTKQRKGKLQFSGSSPHPLVLDVLHTLKAFCCEHLWFSTERLSWTTDAWLSTHRAVQRVRDEHSQKHPSANI